MTAEVTIDGDFYNEAIEKAIKATLQSENTDFDCFVEVVIADEDEIRELNKSTRNIDKVTDVLSYPMLNSFDDITPDADGLVFLGSMVICKQRAEEQAKEYGHSVLREVSFLAVHSTLHLLGYDHETGEKEEEDMFSKQERILEHMGITR